MPQSPTGLPEPAINRWQQRQWLTLGLDALALLTAWFLAHWVRYDLELGGAIGPGLYVALDEFAVVGALFATVMLATMYVWRLYRRQALSSWLDQVGRIIPAALLAEAAIIVVSYLAREAFPPSSRLMFAYLGLAAVVLTGGLRLLVHRWYVNRYRRGIGTERVIVAGRGVLAKMLMQQIRGNAGAGMIAIGFLDHEPGDESDFGRFARLGGIDEIDTVLASTTPDRVIVALPLEAIAHSNDLMAACRRRSVRATVVPDLLALQAGRVHTEAVAGIPLFTLTSNRIAGPNAMLKRSLDLVLAGSLLLLSSPLLALLALAIRLDSPGPVLFGQQRIGRGGQPFRMLKFRSMVRDAPAARYEVFPEARAKALFKPRHDPRITRIGRLLRKTSLDELPQLINVLGGQMSLVGPRAQIPDEVSAYDDYAYNRLLAPPGITGLWQVSGRSNLGFEEMVMLDTYYVGHWSVGLDLKILLRTIPAVLTGEGAY